MNTEELAELDPKEWENIQVSTPAIPVTPSDKTVVSPTKSKSPTMTQKVIVQSQTSTASTLAVSESVNKKSEEEKRKERAARFGLEYKPIPTSIPLSTPGSKESKEKTKESKIVSPTDSNSAKKSIILGVILISFDFNLLLMF